MTSKLHIDKMYFALTIVNNSFPETRLPPAMFGVVHKHRLRTCYWSIHFSLLSIMQPVVGGEGRGG